MPFQKYGYFVRAAKAARFLVPWDISHISMCGIFGTDFLRQYANSKLSLPTHTFSFKRTQEEAARKFERPHMVDVAMTTIDSPSYISFV